MNIKNLNEHSKIVVSKIGDIGSTAVNIAVNLSELIEKKVKIEITEMDIKIDLTKPKDIMKLCTRLLIDQEFGFGALEKSEIEPKCSRKRKKSKLDEHATAIISRINKGFSRKSILKEFQVSSTGYRHWIKTRTKLTSSGKRMLI